MQDDGEVVYAGYTYQELLEALDAINAKSYPLNYRNLVSEISTRPESSNNLQLTEQANESPLPDKRTSAPVTLDQLTGHLFASALLLASGTYGLYTDRWFFRGEHLRGREAIIFYVLLAVATCTNTMRLLSWLRNGGENGLMFRFATQFSFLAIILYIFYGIFSLFGGGA